MSKEQDVKEARIAGGDDDSKLKLVKNIQHSTLNVQFSIKN